MFPSEGVEVSGMEGLDAEGDPGDAEFMVKLRGAGGEGGRIGFEGDFLAARKVKDFPQFPEEQAKMSW